MLKLPAGITLNTILSIHSCHFALNCVPKMLEKRAQLLHQKYLLNQALRIVLKSGANPKEIISMEQKWYKLKQHNGEPKEMPNISKPSDKRGVLDVIDQDYLCPLQSWTILSHTKNS
jgi:hypothetical protein